MLVLGLALVLSTLLARKLPAARVATFDRRPLLQLKRTNPAFVLIGNSMVGTRFDEATLRDALHTRRVSVMGVNGSKSVHWYLMVKNLVVPLGHRPTVILFFRDEELTEPRARTTGAGHTLIERLSRGEEPLVERKIAPPPSEPIARLDWARKRLMPFDRFHQWTDPILEAVANFSSELSWPGAEARERRAAINDLFALSNLRAAAETREPAAPYLTPDFSSVAPAGFLPDLCELAKSEALPLIFVRVRTRTRGGGGANRGCERQKVRPRFGTLRPQLGRTILRHA